MEKRVGVEVITFTGRGAFAGFDRAGVALAVALLPLLHSPPDRSRDLLVVVQVTVHALVPRAVHEVPEVDPPSQSPVWLAAPEALAAFDIRTIEEEALVQRILLLTHNEISKSTIIQPDDFSKSQNDSTMDGNDDARYTVP